MEKLIEKYLIHLESLNYSPVTLTTYKHKLDKFLEYLREKGIASLITVTQDTLETYQIETYQRLTPKGIPATPGTRNNHLKAVKSLYNYLYENDRIVKDPSRNLKYAKLPKRLPKNILTKQEIKKVIETPDLSTAAGYRDRTIMELLYSTGIRRKELINLKIIDIDNDQGLIRILGKGNKERIIPLGKTAGLYLINYIKVVRPILKKGKETGILFYNIRGAPLNLSNVSILVKEAAKKSGVKKGVTPHTFRHTFATHILKGKANIRHVQEMLGHASLSSTQIYTHLNISDLKEVHRKCHPRELE